MQPAMHLREIVAAPKTQIKVGPWRSGKVPRADFPLAKKAYGLGNSYDWQVISFQALGAEFKVLTVLNEGKKKFEAVLGMMGANILKVLCIYEFHPSEPGWHCHAACGEVGTVGAGCMRGPWVLRLPRALKFHRRKKFTVNDKVAAQRITIARYKIEERGSLL
jgi:hypothetical protein